MMRIVIDARMYGLENAGIGRYVMSLINQLEVIDKKNDYLILLRRKYYQGLRFKNRRFQKVIADYPHYSFREQILLPLQLIKLKPDLVHFPHFNVPIFWLGRFVVTIHDLIKHESKGAKTTTRWRLFYWLKYLVYRFVIWLAIKRAVKIIVPSQWWKKEIVKRYHLGERKIVVTYEGVESKFKSQTSNLTLQTILEKYQITRPFIIYVGSLYPHKNVGRLVKAIQVLNRGDGFHFSLVIACSRNVFYQRFRKMIEKMGAADDVNFVGFVSDEKELAALYHQAEAFVFPSLIEGFGLPGLEAMAAGCPVVCSDIPVLREIYGEAALYFNPHDPNDIAKKIKLIVEDDKLRQRLKKLGPELAEGYSWQKMAKETLEVYACSAGLRSGE